MDNVSILHTSDASYASQPSLWCISLHDNQALPSFLLFFQTHGGKIRHLQTSSFSQGILEACSAITVLISATSTVLSPDNQNLAEYAHNFS